MKLTDAQQVKQRKDMINIITRDKEIDSDLRQQTNEDILHMCEKHFQPDEIYQCNFNFGS